MTASTRGETVGIPKAKILSGFCGGSSYPDGKGGHVWRSFDKKSHEACQIGGCQCLCHLERV